MPAPIKPRSEWRKKTWSVELTERAMKMMAGGQKPRDVCAELVPGCNPATEVELLQRAIARREWANPVPKPTAKKCACGNKFKTTQNYRRCESCRRIANEVSWLYGA